MITPDTGASALGLSAAYSFRQWLNSKRTGDAFAAGLILGLAELTKFTWIVLFALWPILWLTNAAYRRWRSHEIALSKEVLQLSGLMLLSVLVVNMGYGFEGSGRLLGRYQFLSQTLRGEDTEAKPSTNRFMGSIVGRIPVPLPANYVHGIDRQKVDFENGFQSYLRGQWRDRGWWYYYAYGFLVKEPLGYLLLFTLAICLGMWRPMRWRESGFLLAPSVVVFVLVSSQTGFNHHLRYVLPVLPAVFVWMGGLWKRVDIQPIARAMVCGLLGTSISASCWVFPHSHAYFNMVAGGPLNGHNHLLDSNIDWGQDILLLADWAKNNPDKPLDAVAYPLAGIVNAKCLSLVEVCQNQTIADIGTPGLKLPRSFEPTPGRFAVFIGSQRQSNLAFAYFNSFQTVQTLGYTVNIYEIDQCDIADYDNEKHPE